MSINYIIDKIKNKEDVFLIEKAYFFALRRLEGIYCDDGESLLNHILNCTNTLIDFNADLNTLVSSILYETINYGTDIDTVVEEYGESIAEIAFKTARISSAKDEVRTKILNEINADSEEDVRSIFILLGESLSNMKRLTEKSNVNQKMIVRDDLYELVQMGRKVKLNYITSQVEDYCLLCLEPESYHSILNRLGGSLDNLKTDLDTMKQDISSLLEKQSINYEIKGRIKTIYSIYNKLSRGKKWEDIYDILAIRILVDNIDDCSSVIDLIHSNYKMVPDRFKDYINNPKENMYQSLHTTILGSDERVYEIQVRTHEMNKTAEEGSASHILYKEKSRARKSFV